MPDDRHDPPHAASAAAASAPPPVPPRMSPPAQDRTGLGILLMSASALIFSMQDGFSRVLGAEYPPVLVVMIRYWVFAAFVIVLVSRQPGGLRRAVRTRRPLTQIARGVLLVLEVVVMVEAFVRLGLVEGRAYHGDVAEQIVDAGFFEQSRGDARVEFDPVQQEARIR